MKLSEIQLIDVDTLLLDRDGVVNVLRPNDYVKTWSEFEFIPGILDAIAKWSKMVNHIFIVTNQRGVGKGLMTEQDLEQIHRQMLEKIVSVGGRIDKIYYCTAVFNDDYRRKPSPGMFMEILRDYPEADRNRTLMIGDSDSDEQFAVNCGIRFIKFDNK